MAFITDKSEMKSPLKDEPKMESSEREPQEVKVFNNKADNLRTKSNAQTIALQILQSTVQLPPLPLVGSQLLAMNQKSMDEIDVDKFVSLIETDPTLVARILSLANSAYFSSVNKIYSIRQAVMRIGLEESFNAVSWFFFQGALPRFPKFEGFSDKDYWSHSWACAVANRMLGRPDLFINCLPGELYIAGLLHGVGKLILAIHRPNEFLTCLEVSREYNQPLFEAELDHFGTTDADIAYEILKSWHFPEKICMAVKYYRIPEKAEAPYMEIAATTQFAYYIANTSGIGNNGDLHCFDLQETVMGRISDFPLSDEGTRNRVVNDIYSALRKKSAVITEEETAKQTETQPPDTNEKITKPSANHSKSKKKVGLLSRLLRFFRK
jgi:HD-like signal output (HDOD) protein